MEPFSQCGETKTQMIDATHFLETRTQEKRRRRLIGRTKGGMNSKLHAVTDTLGRLLRMFLTAGQRSDYVGAQALLSNLPGAKHMLADLGYDADWYRIAPENKGITPCIPSRKSLKFPILHDEICCKKLHKTENSFVRLQDWRGVATRHHRCPKRSSSQPIHWQLSLFSGYEF